ncbi:phospholipase C, phosphocholine-specific [Chitinophaga sedimenti]|uniref:phosphocholine-specific phospholipase C n=1 Tax=Chitinophaga sedimenti TaxID=2033606 RepID=UPI00200412D4|nr:phospholipase C, phosphocholine-specific [Chitinophaga sedimenti]MCK7554652.1 phospholipase C, phosphocholine-specific [Chitinophaga sedimenti]
MDSRRDFLKKAALLSGSGVFAGLPASVQRALAIDPAPGSTFEDAEHVVILMQENRSFDHCYGSLRGVRGFNDPRAITLPSGHPVWLQANKKGETYAPFRLNIKDTKSTRMSSLPHSWENQVDARNDGKYDGWLVAKRSGNKDYREMPLTLGYYTREDLPFYYGLADAFTICDQHFCSSLTGTTPNRLYLWSGTIRPPQDDDSHAAVRNSDIEYDSWATWKSFPERLEEHGVSWRIYQNEVSISTGFSGEEDAWLANFTDNPIEWFPEFNIGYARSHMAYLERRAAELRKEIAALPETDKKYAEKKAALEKIEKRREQFNPANFDKLSAYHKALHEKAFSTNVNDPHYRELSSLTYEDNGKEQTMKVPKGDVLHQFREDVKTGKLPAVSWLVAPENFCDHPSAPWYGAWYVSEVMDILTHNPEVWKKTIFILTYDENDGYFDHVPPFVAPNPNDPATGAVSKSINAKGEWVTREQELRRKDLDSHEARESPIGLGYRVPFVVASPWSRGGYVNSQVFDHTSPLQFLEKFLSKKTGKEIKETNISSWRRAVCGDLTSIFRPYNGEKINLPEFLERNEVLQSIHEARLKPLPDSFKALTPEEIKNFRQTPYAPKQEEGTRPSCALPYELYVNGSLTKDAKTFTIKFKVDVKRFNTKSAGAAFSVYANGKVRNFAVAAGEELEAAWPLEHGKYAIEVYGPNGFYRGFRGTEKDVVSVHVTARSDGKSKYDNVAVGLMSSAKGAVALTDNAYGQHSRSMALKPGSTNMSVDTQHSKGWYDFTVSEGNMAYRFAGRLENGKESISDPAMA